MWIIKWRITCLPTHSECAVTSLYTFFFYNENLTHRCKRS